MFVVLLSSRRLATQDVTLRPPRKVAMAEASHPGRVDEATQTMCDRARTIAMVARHCAPTSKLGGITTTTSGRQRVASQKRTGCNTYRVSRLSVLVNRDHELARVVFFAAGCHGWRCCGLRGVLLRVGVAGGWCGEGRKAR